MDTPVESDGTFSATALDPFVAGDATTLESWALTIPVNGLAPIVELGVFPIIYDDVNSNGEFDVEDTIIGSSKLPFGAKGYMNYVLSYDDIFGFYKSDELWMHQGYNREIEPQTYTVQSINIASDPQIITLDKNIAPGHNDVAFSVFAGLE